MDFENCNSDKGDVLLLIKKIGGDTRGQSGGRSPIGSINRKKYTDVDFSFVRFFELEDVEFENCIFSHWSFKDASLTNVLLTGSVEFLYECDRTIGEGQVLTDMIDLIGEYL